MPCDKTPRPYEPPEELERIGLRGWIVEDVWIDKYDGWEPHIQALKHENGDLSLRIFYYKKDKEGRKGFVSLPCFIYDWTIDDFREEILKCKCSIIRMLLRKYVEAL